MERQTGPFLFGCRDPWTAKSVRFFKFGCRNPWTDLVRIFKFLVASGIAEKLRLNYLVLYRRSHRDFLIHKCVLMDFKWIVSASEFINGHFLPVYFAFMTFRENKIFKYNL